MRSTVILSLKGKRTADCEIAQDFRQTFHHGKCRGEAGRTNNTRLQEVFYGKCPCSADEAKKEVSVCLVAVRAEDVTGTKEHYT